MSIMKFAVCSRSSTASRSPPNVMRGTLAVAALPTGFTRRSSILLVPLRARGRRVDFAEDDTDQLALGPAERCDDVFHAVVYVEVHREDRNEPLGHIKQLAVGRAPRHGRPVENHEVIAAGGTGLRNRLPDGVAGFRIRGVDGRQDRNSVGGLDRAGGLGARPTASCLIWPRGSLRS